MRGPGDGPVEPAVGSAAAGGPPPHDGGPPATSPWAAPAWTPDLAHPPPVPGFAAAGGLPGPTPVGPGVAQVPYGAFPAGIPGAPPGTHPASGGPPPPAPAPPHRWGLGAYLFVQAVFLLASVLVGLAAAGDGPPSVGVLLAALSVPTLLAAGTALLITRLRGNGPRIDLRLAWSWRDVGIGLAFGFGGLALTIPASLLYVAIVGQDASSAVGAVFGGITTDVPTAVLVMLVVVLVAPLCEEIIYRGLLWGGVERLGGPRVAFVVTTLVFALAHFEFTRTPLLLVVALPVAAARLYTGRLLASVVAHQVNNLLPGIALLLTLLGVAPMA